MASSKEELDHISSQLSVLQRSEISNPPTFGARIMNLIMNDPAMFDQWKEDIRTMSFRIVGGTARSKVMLVYGSDHIVSTLQIEMRKQLRDRLENKFKTPGSWEHITKQIGM